MDLYALNQLKKFRGRVVWLSSYPKSGNTWLRAFLTTLFLDKPLENLHYLINDVNLYSKAIYEELVCLEPSYLTIEEMKNYRKEVVEVATTENYTDRLLFSKTHEKELTFLNEQNTHAIIYLIRDPINIIPSLANHNNSSIQDAIQFMKNPQARYNRQPSGFNFLQDIGTWQKHVSYWINHPLSPLVIKYEDMLENPLATFTIILEKLLLNFPKQRIKRAIQNSSFSALKNLEKRSGFSEKNSNTKKFFRRGKNESKEEILNLYSGISPDAIELLEKKNLAYRELAK